MTAQPLADFQLQMPALEVLDSRHAPNTQLIDAHEMTGWSSATAAYGFTGEGQTVVVIDSGIAYNHAALGGGFGAGYQVVGGWDFTEENDANPYDDGPWGAHGTHVAGIIGSQDAVHSGVAPGVDLVALRVFNDEGKGYFDWIEDALGWVHENRFAFDNPITTVNLSIGSTWNADAIPHWAILEDEFAQLEADGIFISVAAGNDFADYGTTGLSYPAASSHVVPVAALDDDGSLSFFSQRNDRVIAAPGRSITSTLPDYVGNLNGRDDDFGSLSGTSMAAPYVAGASVLLREALELTGVVDVTQEVIYDWMCDTADPIFDSATGATYHRLNLGAALDAIMPDDDFGSQATSAHALGTVVDATNISGLVGRLDDWDYFSFTAGSSGRVNLFADTTDSLVTEWHVSGLSTEFAGTELAFDVLAGQEYVVGLGTSEGLGYFDLSLTLDADQIDLGTVASERVDAISLVNGPVSYTLTASRDGVLTVEALFSQISGDVAIELFDSGGNRLADARGADGLARVDVNAAAGQSFVVTLTGANANIDLRLTNLVNVDGNVVESFGTVSGDRFTLVAGAMFELDINGVGYRFDPSDVDEFSFSGLAANDQISHDDSASGGMEIVRLNGPASTRLVAATQGDANLDGFVDQDDYVLWAQGFGTENPTFTSGDFNQDGAVDSSDYTIWADRFGQGSPSALTPSTGAGDDSSPANHVTFAAAESAGLKSNEPGAVGSGRSQFLPAASISMGSAIGDAAWLRVVENYVGSSIESPWNTAGDSGNGALREESRSGLVLGTQFDVIPYVSSDLRETDRLDIIHSDDSETWLDARHPLPLDLAGDQTLREAISEVGEVGPTLDELTAESLIAALRGTE